MIYPVDVLTGELLRVSGETPLEGRHGHEVVSPLVYLRFGDGDVDVAVGDF